MDNIDNNYVQRKTNKREILMISLIVVLTAILLVLMIMQLTNNTIANMIEDKKWKEKEAIMASFVEESYNIKKVEIVDDINLYSGQARPICVMIDNEPGAYPQAGMQEAMIIYECIVEGGQTRFMAVFKEAGTTKIGPIRSSRHYFVRFTLEYGAIYAHFGWSPQAQNLIKQAGVNNVNGMYYDGGLYWREGSGYHTSFTSLENLQTIAKQLGYVTYGSTSTHYSYNKNDTELSTDNKCEDFKLTYSAYHTVEYKYDSARKIYLRYQRGEEHTDRDTNQQLYAKNIIVMYAKNYNIGDGSARQEVENIGEGKGHYITNGKIVDITWSKKDNKSKTYFYDANNNEIALNDGTTFIQVVPNENLIEIII